MENEDEIDGEVRGPPSPLILDDLPSGAQQPVATDGNSSFGELSSKDKLFLRFFFSCAKDITVQCTTDFIMVLAGTVTYFNPSFDAHAILDKTSSRVQLEKWLNLCKKHETLADVLDEIEDVSDFCLSLSAIFEVDSANMDTVKKSITRSTASKTFGANPISVYSATHSNTLQENFVLQLLVWIAGESAHFSQFSKSLADVKSMLNSQAQDLNYQEFVTKHTAAVQILYDSSEKQDAIQWERVSDLCNDVALVLGIKMSNEDSKILKIDDLNTDTASSSNIVDLPLSNGCKKLDLTKELFFHILYLIAKPCTNISEYMKVLIETLSQFGPCKISLLSLMQQSEQAELQTFLNNCLQHESFEKLLGKLDDRENVYTSLAGIFQKQFIAIFWDIENCQVPRGVSAEAVVSKLRNKIFDGYQGIEIIAACSEKAISSETRNELHQSGVRLIDVAEGKDRADITLGNDMERYALDRTSTAINLVVISSDGHFQHPLSIIQDYTEHDVFVFHKKAVSEKLKDFKELPISWEDFLDDLPKNTKKEPRKKKKEPCRPLISVSNLPAEHDVKEIRNKLNKLTSAHGGKVQKICRTAEIAFSTKEMAERAKQALDGEKVFDSTVCAKLVD